LSKSKYFFWGKIGPEFRQNLSAFSYLIVISRYYQDGITKREICNLIGQLAGYQALSANVENTPHDGDVTCSVNH